MQLAPRGFPGRLAFGLSVVAALLVAACGGGESTPTRMPLTPTTPPPMPTVTPAAPTPTAIPGVPTPVINRQGKRGGVMQLMALPGQPAGFGFDTYEAGAPSASYEVWNPLFNNLIWPDPYGGRQALVGDLAETWNIGEDGTEITFTLRKGVRFHDGQPFTSRDVVYNIERGALSPRSPTMTFFKARLSAVKRVTAPDDHTVKVTLSATSNVALLAMGQNQMSMYPAHLPFPEKLDQFKEKPIGTGPFQVKTLETGVKLEWVRNDSYWKEGLPYLDAIVYTPARGQTVVAAFRTGKADHTTFTSNDITPSIVEILKRETGFIAYRTTNSTNLIVLNQREPFTDPRVREALSLAVDRQALNDTWQEGVGNPFASPLLPPEMGGLWGISTEEMKKRPGFRPERDQDIARARQLVAETGLADRSLSVLTSAAFRVYGEVVDANLRAVGMKTRLEIQETAQITPRLLRGDFEIYLASSSTNIDDPSDAMSDFVVTGASQNWAKWSSPELDRLLKEQDRTLDTARRRAILLQVQEITLDQHFGAFIPTLIRRTYMGHQPRVKNAPSGLPLLHSPWYRWEQVWLEP